MVVVMAALAIKRSIMSKPIKTIQQYHSLVSGYAEKDSLRPMLIALNSNLQAEFDKPNSGLKTALSSLSEREKTSLIRALLVNDKQAIKTLLSGQLDALKLSPFIAVLPRLCEHLNDTSDGWFNPIVAQMIGAILSHDVMNPEAVMQNKRIIQDAMQTISDSLLPIKTKFLICKAIDRQATREISDLSYNESITPLKKNQYSGAIKLESFLQAIKADPLDYSQFIMLTLGYLQTELSAVENIDVSLNHIRQLYLATNYEAAIKELAELSHTYQHQINAKAFKQINTRKGELVEVDIYRNFTRRYFENRVAQIFAGTELDLAVIDKMSQRFIHRPVTTVAEAESVVLSICDDPTFVTHARYQALKSQSETYQTKDRVDKVGFSDKSMESVGTILNEEIWSQSRGVMTSLSPTFFNERSRTAMRNRVVDVAETWDADFGYSFRNPRSAFVGSFSGHCYKIVVTLETYMKQHQTDAHLQRDVNHFLKAVVFSYIARGYHGYLELIDVLKEAHVQKVFTDLGVKLDLGWADGIVEKASKDTQEYTKQLCLKRTVMSGLLKFSSIAKAVNHEAVDEDSQLVAQHDGVELS